MNRFYTTLSDTSSSILHAIGLGLGLSDPTYLLRFHSGINNQLRLLHYPPIPAKEVEEGRSARMEAHSDWGSITLLFQDECGGLEVQRKDGQFVNIAPVEGALVMNVGDMLMRWSNGMKLCLAARRLAKLTVHRLSQVHTPPSHPSTSRGPFHWLGTSDQGSVFDSVLRFSGRGCDSGSNERVHWGGQSSEVRACETEGI